MKNAIRFWHYGTDSPVLIKIKAGQTLTYSHGGPTDEGWSSDSYEWHFDGKFLRQEHVSDGADCDGRLTRFYESICHVSQIANGYADSDASGVVYPAWKPVNSSQRDYTAEFMGY